MPFSFLQHVVLIHHLHVGRKCRLHSSLFTLGDKGQEPLSPADGFLPARYRR